VHALLSELERDGLVARVRGTTLGLGPQGLQRLPTQLLEYHWHGA
jgi:hypothetical protein